jgi:hypothetical protein
MLKLRVGAFVATRKPWTVLLGNRRELDMQSLASLVAQGHAGFYGHLRLFSPLPSAAYP